MNWITHGHIYHLIFGSYAHGWLGFLEPTTVVSFAQQVSRFDWQIRIFTLLIEFGAILFLWRRASLIAFLGGWTLFHWGIFAISGICVWTWMVVDATLFALFLWNRQARSLQIFTRQHFLLSILLVGCGIFWVKPFNLSWYDTRLSYTYRCEAVGESGNSYTLSPRFFAPYDHQFTQGNFGYLVERPQLSVTMNVTSHRATADALMDTKTPDQVYALELEAGINAFNAHRAAKFDHFLKRFIGNFNVRRSNNTALSRLRLQQMWTFPSNDAFKGEERLRRVIVNRITSLYDGVQYLEIRTEAVREINIAGSE